MTRFYFHYTKHNKTIHIYWYWCVPSWQKLLLSLSLYAYTTTGTNLELFLNRNASGGSDRINLQPQRLQRQ